MRKNFMKKLPKWLTILLTILAPIGIIYLLLHTMSRDFKCFCTVIIVFSAGILFGIWLVCPEKINYWIDVINIFN